MKKDRRKIRAMRGQQLGPGHVVLLADDHYTLLGPRGTGPITLNLSLGGRQPQGAQGGLGCNADSTARSKSLHQGSGCWKWSPWTLLIKHYWWLVCVIYLYLYCVFSVWWLHCVCIFILCFYYMVSNVYTSHMHELFCELLFNLIT